MLYGFNQYDTLNITSNKINFKLTVTPILIPVNADSSVVHTITLETSVFDPLITVTIMNTGNNTPLDGATFTIK
jgi:hypothetical protein